MAYYVYLLTSGKHGTLYLGVTNDLVRRVHEHRGHAVPGFSARYGVVRLVWFEIYDDAITAIASGEAVKEVAARLENSVDRRAESGVGGPVCGDLQLALGVWIPGSRYARPGMTNERLVRWFETLDCAGRLQPGGVSSIGRKLCGSSARLS